MAKQSTPKTSSKGSAGNFDDIKTRRDQIKSAQSQLKTIYNDIADMYWMANSPNINTTAFDPNDIRYTISPTPRNQVVGLHRLLRSSKPEFHIERVDDQDVRTQIEEALTAWWDASCARKRAPIHSDLALSGVLFSDCNLTVTSVQDMIDIPSISPIRKQRLQSLLLRTPILFEADSAFYTYPVWGDDGLQEYLRIYTIKGKALMERWGAQNLDENQDYTLNDYFDTENRCVWADEIEQPLLGPEPYEMPDIPCFSAVADGTDLFVEEERKRQPFLYALDKSNLAQRDDELLTVLFTSIYSRGVGPLIVVDSTKAGSDSIKVTYKGITRILEAPGGAQIANDTAFDANLIELRNALQGIVQESTINSQTLGADIESGTPYSGYSMASQSGRLPILPVQEACQKVICDAASFALRYYKQGGMTWKDSDGNALKPASIPDDFMLTVKLEVDLPQDQFKMAQIVSQMPKDIVSMEWIHNLLQIHNSEKMMRDVMTDKALQLAFTTDMPNLMQEMIQMANSGGNPTANEPATNVPANGQQLPTGQIPPTPPAQPNPQAAEAGAQPMPPTGEPMPPTAGIAPGTQGGQ